ncbi:ankyrin repeat-containing domain protein [Elsinoe ampelina]|uniref:Ankyrin repeat-containing domain protein n=1 Tax=Elsinoe ampelina TaxID=302913 RepID=A0A6A6GMZ7_9PEZI|nr:ankyrin repeat-containing domain protein [Elsinoe ampelina]
MDGCLDGTCKELMKILISPSRTPHGEQILALLNGPQCTIRDTATGDGPLLMILRDTPCRRIGHSIVSRLVKDGFDPNERNHRGDTPLHRAVRQISDADISVLQALLHAGADIHARDYRGRTPLHYARLGGTTVVEFLISCGADLEAQDRAGETWLMSYISRLYCMSLADVEGAIALGASVDTRDSHGRTILHKLTGVPGLNFQEDTLRAFVRHGASPEAVDFRGNTLLHVAMSKFDLNVRETDILLSWGLDMSSRNVAGRTPLHCLCAWTGVQQNGWDEAVAIVFDKADDLDVQDLQGITPLHLACTCSEVMVERLLRAGSDASILTHQGLTCLHLAARCRQANALGTLLEHQRKVMPSRFAELVNSRDCTGRTPLHHACRSGRVESVTLLLDEGADITARDCKGRTPLWTCSEYDEEQKLWENTTSAAI